MEHSRNTVWKFAGLVFCADCGRALTRSTRKDGKVLRCPTYSRIGKEYCSQHLIYEYELEEIIMREIKNNISDALKNMDLENARHSETKRRIHEESSRLNIQLENAENNYKRMVMNLSTGIIDEEDFLIFKEQYQEKKRQIEKRKSALQSRTKNDILLVDEYQRWLDNFLRYREIDELSREVLINLIDRIDVYEGEKIHISFKFKKPIQ